MLMCLRRIYKMQNAECKMQNETDTENVNNTATVGRDVLDAP